MGKLGVVGVAGWLLVALVAPSFGTELGISPPDITIQISPGQSYQGEIFVFGSDVETTDMTIYKNDWALTLDGGYQFLPPGTVERSASAWLTLPINHLSLAPKTGQRVKYRLKVPANASGSYWAAIMFATAPKTFSGQNQLRLAMSGRIAYILRVDVHGSPPGNAVVEGFQLTWDERSQKLLTRMRIQNRGTSFVHFKGQLELRDRQGRVVNALPFNEGWILPNSAREFSLQDYHFEFKPGFYVALALADFGEKSVKAVQTSFEVP